MYAALLSNFVVVVAIVSLWMNFRSSYPQMSPHVAHLIFGVVMGLASAVSMAMGVDIAPGIHIDLRTALVGLAGMVAGPWAAIIATAIALTYRIILDGDGVMIGSVLILLAAASGIALHSLQRPALKVVLLAVAIGGGYATVSILNGAPVSNFLLSLVGLNFAVALLSGFIILSFKRRIAERSILLAALKQAPDTYVVKDVEGHVLMTNWNNVTTGLSVEELQVLTTGTAILQQQHEHGDRWYSTSTVALRDAEGETVGVSSSTRDITEVKRNRQLLEQAINAMSDGVALFSNSGNLLLSNDRYREIFPDAMGTRRAGAHITDILRALVSAGEIETDDGEAWIAGVASKLFTNRDEEMRQANGRWIQLRTRVCADGSALVVLQDVTNHKSAATTDPLTGLANRRAFDAALEAERVRAVRSNQPLSLLFVDVDHFKMYNDAHGHQAGDEALQEVSDCLREVCKRSTDIVARYGGEEFVAILPYTTADQARELADEFRAALRRCKISTPAGRHKIVTASVGVACMSEQAMSARTLIRLADEAVYEAKRLGRDRTDGSVKHTAEEGIDLGAEFLHQES